MLSNCSASVIRRTVFIGTVFAAFWGGVTPALAQVPASYQDLYSMLEGKLDTFVTSIRTQSDGSTAPVIYSAGLVTANGNGGASLLVPTRRAAVQLEIDRLYNIGARAVTVNVSYPLFFEPFFAFNGTPAMNAQLIDFYKFVASEVRRRGMYLIVETGVLFPGFYSSSSGFNLSGFYGTLNATTYASGRATTAANIARELQPDFLSIGAEPDNEAVLTGVASIASPPAWATVVRTIVNEVRNAGSLVPLGSGIGTWAPRGTEYIDAMATAGLDYVDLHVYPVNGNILDATLGFVNQAMSKGLRVGMTEAWLLKQRDTEFTRIDVATDPQIFARDAFSFWAPLDQKFIEAMTRLAQHRQFLFLSPFWSKYFWAYLNYNDVSQMSAEQIAEASNVASAQGIVEGRLTETGMAYGRLNRPPNTSNPVNVLSAASFTSTALTPNGHASGFGANLTTSTAQATALPLPTELGGVTVNITDIAGTSRPASLVFVSPGQVNFLMPEGLQPGWARVTVRSPSGVSEAQVIIRNVAPSVFSANFRGSGLAAAIATIIRPDGSRTDKFVASCATDGNCSPIPVDLGTDADRAFLSLYGTGIRGVSSASNVRVNVGGMSLTPIFAGPQPQYAGLDQVNVELPKTLRGRGQVNVELVVDRAVANVVTVQIQ